MVITERQVIEQAYQRHRLASQHAGHIPLTFEQWEKGLRDEALRLAVLETERELVLA